MPATWKHVRRRRQRRRPEGPVQPGRRDLRRRALPEGRRRRHGRPRAAIFAYNHADWYVDSVLLRARLIGGLPANLVGSLTGLTQGRFPVARQGDLRRRGPSSPSARPSAGQNAALVVESHQRPPRDPDLRPPRRARGRRQRRPRRAQLGGTKRLGRFIQLQDVYGNTYTYAHLGKVAATYPAPKPRKVTQTQIRQRARAAARRRRKPTERRLGDRQARPQPRPTPHGKRRSRRTKPRVARTPAAACCPPPRRPSSACSPTRSRPTRQAAGGDRSSSSACLPAVARARPRRRASTAARLSLKQPAQGRLARSSPARSSAASAAPRPRTPRTSASRSARPAAAPRAIDPKPILDGWKLLESTAIYRAKGKNPFFGADAEKPIDRPDPADEQGRRCPRHVLADPRIDDLRLRPPATSAPAQIDRRVLATLEFLAASGLKPTVTALEVRPQLPDHVGQRLRALHRQRGRHRRGQRHPDRRPPGQGLDHRPRRSSAC